MARMMDRELSTLEFHARVLAEAADSANPLLERANFLGIADSGLQEFICVRLGSLTAKKRRGDEMRPSGMMVSQVLDAAWERCDDITNRLDEMLHAEVLPALAQQGVKLVSASQTSPVQMASLCALFTRDVMPRLEVVVPDEDGKLPRLPSGRTCIAAVTESEADAGQLAVIVLPDDLPGIIQLAGKGCWITLEEAVKANLHLLLNGQRIRAACAFRVLRATHAACKTDETDLRKAVQDCLARRAKGRILRLDYAGEPAEQTVQLLCRALGVRTDLLRHRGGMLDIAGVMRALTKLPGMDNLRYEPWTGAKAPEWQSDMFAMLRVKDQLLCHPYDSFEPVLALLEQAAEDPEVQQIHMTLYRVSEQSRVLAALKQAAGRGAAVHVCVEPRARMDEMRNLSLMDELEQAGCRVYTGIAGLKVHGKALMILRREGGTTRRYVHLGTGNYNESTAARYTDMGLLSADELLCADAERFFDYLEGRREQPDLQAMSSSPQGMRQELLRLIRREMEKAVRGESSGIACMLNALTDSEMIGALEEAARCGVKIDITVRGACCLIPGRAGETENITVRSVVGRCLEHCRVFAFGAQGEETVFMSSADWMKRSLGKRVELLIPVKDPRCRQKLLQCMHAHSAASVRAWRLEEDGWKRPHHDGMQDAQQVLMRLASSGWLR